MKGSTWRYHPADGFRCKHQGTCPGTRWMYSARIDGKNHSKRGFASKKEADAALSQLLASVAGGTHVAPSRTTLAGWVTEWLEAVSRDLEPKTLESYTWVLRRYVLPTLGTKRLDRLEPADFDRLYSQMAADGRSRTTTRLVHAVVRSCLTVAVQRNKIQRNPVVLAKPGKKQPYRPQVWSAAEVAVFLDAVRGSRLEALWVVYATTGCRRGEGLALTWDDLDLERRLLHVSKSFVRVNGRTTAKASTKTDRARAVDVDEETVGALQAHAGRQADELAFFGATPQGRSLIFCRGDGQPLRPDDVTMEFNRIVSDVGLRKIRLHDLRHSHASLLLKAGTPIKVVSERLGHASPVITMTVYAHCLPGMQADAASQFRALLKPTSPTADLLQ